MTRQDWRTVPSVFAQLDRSFGPFRTDAAASNENHLCDHFITEEIDALRPTTQWGDHGRFFVNIPFGRPLPWVRKAAEQTRAWGYGGTMLVQAGLSAQWLHEALAHARLIIPDRRIQYWHPDESPWGYDREGKLVSRNFDRDSILLEFTNNALDLGRVVSHHIEPHHEEVRALWRKANKLAADWMPPKRAQVAA